MKSLITTVHNTIWNRYSMKQSKSRRSRYKRQAFIVSPSHLHARTYKPNRLMSSFQRNHEVAPTFDEQQYFLGWSIFYSQQYIIFTHCSSFYKSNQTGGSEITASPSLVQSNPNHSIASLQGITPKPDSFRVMDKGLKDTCPCAITEISKWPGLGLRGGNPVARCKLSHYVPRLRKWTQAPQFNWHFQLDAIERTQLPGMASTILRRAGISVLGVTFSIRSPLRTVLVVWTPLWGF